MILKTRTHNIEQHAKGNPEHTHTHTQRISKHSELKWMMEDGYSVCVCVLQWRGQTQLIRAILRNQRRGARCWRKSLIISRQTKKPRAEELIICPERRGQLNSRVEARRVWRRVPWHAHGTNKRLVYFHVGRRPGFIYRIWTLGGKNKF